VRIIRTDDGELVIAPRRTGRGTDRRNGESNGNGNGNGNVVSQEEAR
jgi:hypothetical protein